MDSKLDEKEKLIGKIFGKKYEIVELLGEGSFG